MYKDEVRPATQAEIATVQGQLTECNAIATEVASGMYGTNQELSQFLAARTQYLEQWLGRAAAGEPVFLQDGHVPLHQGPFVQAIVGHETDESTSPRM